MKVEETPYWRSTGDISVVEERFNYNIQILIKLLNYFKAYPHARFHQALINLGINASIFDEDNIGPDYDVRVDNLYYEESAKTFERIEKYETSRNNSGKISSS